MALATSTLRPGLLVNLSTTIRGNVSYETQDIERERRTEDGATVARWETTRIVEDAQEQEDAVKVRSKARSLITAVCAHSAFGLLCPEDAKDKLDAALAEAQSLADDFNSRARLTRVGVFAIAGRIAADDVMAVRAINSEIRDLMDDMARGLQNLDTEVVRTAASKAKALGNMLSVEAGARVQMAIDAARSAARRITKAGEEGSIAIDKTAIARVREARTAFLDFLPEGEESEVAAPAAVGRAVDLQALAEKWPDVDDVGAALTAVKPALDDHPMLCQCAACVAEFGDTAVVAPAPAARAIELD